MEGTTAVPTSAPTGTESTAPSSAGSAAAPSSTPITPDQRPTFAQAFATDAASQTTETPAQPEGATTPPADATVDPQSAIHASTEKPGPIPLEVHRTALDNARTKARAEASAEFDRDYGWAKQVPRETMQEWSGIAQLMSSDPPAFLEKYFAEAAIHPTFGPQVKSWAARNLAARVPPVEAMPSADVQILDNTGQVVGMTYSEKQLAARDAWAEKQTLGKVDKELQPFRQEREQKEAAAKAAEHQKQVNAKVDDYVADVSEVLEITAQTTPEERTALFAAVADLITKDAKLSPYKAAMQVRKSHVVPKLAGKAQSKVLDDLKTRAGAQSVNPAGAVVASTHKPTSFHDPALKW